MWARKNTEERATHRSKEKAKKESILISLTFPSICFHLSDIFYIVATFIASKINYIVANISKKGDSKHGRVRNRSREFVKFNIC